MGLLSYAFNSYRPKELGLLTYNVITNMKTDDRFVSLKLEVLILESAYTPFWGSYTESLKGGTDRRDLRDELIVPVRGQMNKLAHLVEAFVGNNVALAQASGFKLKKTAKTSRASKSSPKDLTPPFNLKITNVEGKLGWATLSWSGSEGSKSYDVEMRIQGDAEWGDPKHTTKQSMTFTDLPPGKYIEFHVSSYGTGESESDFSSVVGIWAS